MLFANGGIFVAAASGAVLTSRPEDWAPLSLLGLLFVLAAGSELLNVEIIRDLRLSGSFVAFVLAMALLGPAPAAALMSACMLIDAVVTRSTFDRMLINVGTFAAVGLLGGLTMGVLGDPRSEDPLWFAAAVFGLFMGANTLNFLMIATSAHLALGVPLQVLRRS